MLSFVLDQNLGLPACDEPWKTTLAAAGIAAHETGDLAAIDRALADHEPDFAYVPTADFHHLLRSGDEHYRGLTIATSKFTGEARATMVLEDVWRTAPDNAEKKTKVIGKYDSCRPPVVIARKELEQDTCTTLLAALLAWVLDLDQLPDR